MSTSCGIYSTNLHLYKGVISGVEHILGSDQHCWFASDVTAAMLGVKNKSVSLQWEMNSILM